MYVFFDTRMINEGFHIVLILDNTIKREERK